MISSGAIMANEVPLKVVIDTQVETLKIFDVYKIHVDVIEIIFIQIIYNFLIISLCSLKKRSGHSIGIKNNDHQLLVVSTNKFFRFVQDIFCGFKRILVQ